MNDDDSIMGKDGTVARSSADIVRFFFLQRLEDVLRAEKAFYGVVRESGAYAGVIREWRASLRSLFRLCEPRLTSKDKNDYEFSPVVISGLLDFKGFGEDEALGEATLLLVRYLELDMKLTDISKVQEFDRTNPFLSNKMKGFK